MKKNSVLLICCVWIAFVQAQTASAPLSLFKTVDMRTVQLRENLSRDYVPEKYETYQLDFSTLQSTLSRAPREFTAAARQRNCVLNFPVAGGGMEAYSLWETAMMDADLAKRYPGIRTYAGESLEHPGQTIHLTVSNVRGMRAMVLRPDMGVEHIEPYRWGQTAYYMAFNRADVPTELAPKLARLNESELMSAYESTPYTPPAEDRGTLLEPVRLKIYRYAASTTGLFAQDHGGTVESALAAVTEYTGMISAIYERDLAIRLQLAPNNDKIIWIDPNTDPFTGETVGEWMAQNALVVGTVIGQNNFDLGHVYARYISGAAIGVAGGRACENSKARGCSAGNGKNDYGPFFVSVVGQETGHQMSGGHSWNRCDSTGGRSPEEAFEPGSGSTIMSYAGACGSDNVQGTTDLYFHVGSVEVIRKYALATPPTCGFWQELPNTIPTVTLPYTDGFYIPISTFFELKGSATDADGDALTYCWEEVDAGPEVPLGQPQGNAAIFRTFPAVANSNRYFPRISQIINNTSNITEQLPTYSRDLTFRLTARDNKAGGGGLSWAEVAFKVYEGAGPFRVTNPNSFNQLWQVGEYEQVTWTVANTDKSPVNCTKVNIRLSTDGGQTYPIMLAEGTENDGSQYVLVPNHLTSSARIRVEGANNIFFDISNRNFRILAPTQPTFSMAISNENSLVCLPATFQTTLSAAGTLGFNTPAKLRIKDPGVLPPASKYSFSSTTLAPGGSVTLSIDLPNAVGTIADSFVIVAEIPGFDTLERKIFLNTSRNDFSGLGLQSPADGATGLALNQTLRWKRALDATSYDVQLATSPAFNPADIIATRSATPLDSFKLSILLQKSKGYYWRVRPVNSCGAGEWTDAGFFATLSESCTSVSANDLPKTIPSSGTPTVESKITINGGGPIGNILVKQLKFNHQFFKEVDASLISPQGTEIILFKNKCGAQNGTFNFSFTDIAPSTLDCQSLVNVAKTARPETPLANLKGQNSAGIWTLRMRDNTGGSGGNIQEFSLEFCTTVSLNGPSVDRNEVLTLDQNTVKVIGADLLHATDANNTPAQLTFTVSTAARYGHLEKSGVTLNTGDTFTQADIDAGLIRYVDHGSGRTEDYFRFTVSDGEGGFVGTPKFIIRVVVGIDEAKDLSRVFSVFPNPASEQVWIAFGKPLTEETQVSMMDVSGRLVKSVVMGVGSDRQAFALNGLPKGLYFVRIDNKLGTGVKKVTVQ